MQVNRVAGDLARQASLGNPKAMVLTEAPVGENDKLKVYRT